MSKEESEGIEEFLSKTLFVGKEISKKRFYKRPGKWCAWCDFLPICMGDKKRIEESLERAG